MAGRLDDTKVVEAFDFRAFVKTDEIGRLRDRRVFGRLIEGMGQNGDVRLADVDGKRGIVALQFVDRADMIEVGMREKNARGGKIVLLELRGDEEAFAAGVDDPCFVVDCENRAVDGVRADFNGKAI